MTNEKVEYTVQQAPMRWQQCLLPVMTYVVADDWIDKLGEKAFCFWLKLHGMVDRTGNKEEHRVPTSQGNLAKRCKMTKVTLYNYLKPLYEYGLIDYITYEGGKSAGNKPENIVVYNYPLNEHSRQIQPLEKLRSWEDRTAIKFEYTKTDKGGRPKKEDSKPEQPKQPEQPEQPVNESKEIAEFVQDADISSDSKLTILANLEKYRENKVDVYSLVKWLIQKESQLGSADVALVLEQLANYHETIRNTLAFIVNTLAMADTLRKAKKQEIKGKQVEGLNTYTPTVKKLPLYDWLNDGEENDKDLPF